MLDPFPKENLKLYKRTGEIIDNVKALVDGETFFIDNTEIIIEEGDYFERILPNGAKEIYEVTDRGFYKGMNMIPDQYQTKVKKVNYSDMQQDLATNNLQIKKEIQAERRPQKVFISHSSKDKAYVKALVELFESIGLTDKSMICTSVPGYGIPGGENIYDWLRSQFTECDLRVVFVLSKNYYDSIPCLNEMGAAWVTKAADTLIVLPGFDFNKIEGCLDNEKVGIDLNAEDDELKFRLDELKDTLIKEHSLNQITSAIWERRRDEFIKLIREVSS